MAGHKLTPSPLAKMILGVEGIVAIYFSKQIGTQKGHTEGCAVTLRRVCSNTQKGVQ